MTLQNFEFQSFSGASDVQENTPVVWGGGSENSSRQPCDHEGKQLMPPCTQATILIFTCSTVFNKLHETVDTLSSSLNLLAALHAMCDLSSLSRD